MKLASIKTSWVSYLTLLAFLITGFLMINNKPRRIIYSDASGYYLYLPAVFIHHSFKIEDKSGTLRQHNENGIIYDKYSSGVAYLEAPFFLAAHAWAKISEQEADGYSQPYHSAMRVSALFYCTVALLMLYRLLRRYFTEGLALLTLLGIYFGTNLFYYTILESGMPHVYNFFLCTCIVTFTDSFYKKPTTLKTIALGLILGFTTLTRPTNVILILVVAFWECYNIQQLKQRLTFFLEQWKRIIVAAPFIIIPWIPQMFYWKALQGKWFFYSYGNEGFPYVTGEKFFHVLLHPQGGLFLYSPLLLFPLIGLILCLRNKTYSAPVIAIVMTIATYIFSSWWRWWFGGSFGHRCFVDFYPLLVLPLAYFLFIISKQANWLRYGIIPFAVLMTYVSVGLALSYDPPWDGPQWGWDDYTTRIIRIFTTRYW